ncbi:hypothetical protein [Neobacillus terrae]|uniref:hypothetical protein n=1 Tax=Neobacillus terrae TaxID=3034837 RepID=UPI00140A5BDD|nr:hypothetical protein [Neobacillus terrae]NHM31901.1 hypothetical protein [Neobacillus terrae]
MKEKKKKGWKWFFLGIGLIVLIGGGVLFASIIGRMSLHNLSVPKQAQGFVQDTFQIGKDFEGDFNIKSLQDRGRAALGGFRQGSISGNQNGNKDLQDTKLGQSDEKFSQQGPKFDQSRGEMMEHRDGHHGEDGGILLWGFGGLFALLFGWYLRRVKGKKGLGNLFIFVGVLPILPVILIVFLAYWLVKKIRSGKKIKVPEFIPTSYENSMNAQLLDEWERKLKLEGK